MPPPLTPFKGSGQRSNHNAALQQQQHPHPQHAGTGGSVSGTDDVSMDEHLCYSSAGEDSYSVMLSSPPKAPRNTRVPRYAGVESTTSRLFADENEYENQSPNVHSSLSSSKMLDGGRPKPFDLNSELASVDDTKTMTLQPGPSSSLAKGGGPRMAGGSSTRHRGPYPTSMTRHHRKRHAEQTLVGRDFSFDEDDEDSELNLSNDDNIMYTSPRLSPHPSSIYKSPSSYRTMDGRTVQSKNPFSPMLMEDAQTAASSVTSNSSGTPGRYGSLGGERVSSAAALTESLGFPVSFETNGGGHNSALHGTGGVGNGVPSFGAPLLRHRLHKRESLVESPTNHGESYEYNAFTRDGYPHKTGRFSFTGSPIKESDMGCSSATNSDNGPALPPPPTSHKVRRFTKSDDVSAASYYGGGQQEHEHNNHWRLKLEVDTDMSRTRGSGYMSPADDGISPTDVLSFPMMSSPPRTANHPPPTPAKGKAPSALFYNNRRPGGGGYPGTPERKERGRAPETPKPERHRRARSFDDLNLFGDEGAGSDTERGGDDDCMSLGHSTDYYRPRPRRREAASRFHSDFDVIGELGKGTFGSVFKVLSRLDGCMYAVKAAHRPAKGSSDKDRMLKEVYALAALSDQSDSATFHIVRYHQAWMEENRLYIQTELCTCTLSDEIKRNSMNTEQRRYKFLREILLALEFIHRNGMVHLDIKPENIFVSCF
jgi:hypothetical protein